jgi:hypothetical protein
MEAIRSSETSVNTTSTWCHIPEDCFLHSHRRENLKSYLRGRWYSAMEQWYNDNYQRKSEKTGSKTSSGDISSTIKTLRHLGLNPRLHVEKPAPNRLNYGTPQYWVKIVLT